MGVVLDEAKPARRLVEAVQAHDEALELAALGEEGVDLLFGGVEGQVTDVEGRGVAQLLLEVRGGRALSFATVVVSLALLVL